MNANAGASDDVVVDVVVDVDANGLNAANGSGLLVLGGV